MAERRMFTNKVTESDAFLEMPMSSQALYFHLCMNADDDGFVKNPKSIQRLVGAKDDDLKLLIAKKFVLPFENGIIVIKHWRMHNLLRKDRYKPSEYVEQKSMLYLKDNGAYTLDETKGKLLLEIVNEEPQKDTENNPEKEDKNGLATNRQPNGNQMAPQDSIGKDRVSIELDKELLLAKNKILMNVKEKVINACAYAYGRGNVDKYIDLIIEALSFACQNERAEIYAEKKRDSDFWNRLLESVDLPYICGKTVQSLKVHQPKFDAIRYTLGVMASEWDTWKEKKNK